MQKNNKTKNIILAPLLIISLLSFNFPALPVLAEENNSGEAQTTEGENSATIETGDANVEVNVENQVNTNETEVGQEETVNEQENQNEQESQSSNESETGIEGGSQNDGQGETEEQESLENTNENEAEVENNITAQGQSGENAIYNNSGDSSIDTGDVNVVMGVINNVNSNFIGSGFKQFLLNIFEKLKGDIDLTDKINISPPLESCDECLDLESANESEGKIENNIFIEGSSGDNEAESENGDAKIKTGNVNVSANVFNLLNTNFIGANWQSFIINVFSDWTGDIILPGKEKMKELFDSLSGNGKCQDCGVSVDNSSEGHIENEVSVKTDTGQNVAVGKATITRTGESKAKTNILNIANTNITAGNWFFMVINNLGEWKGNIFSLPPDLEMTNGEDGIKIYNMNLEDFSDPSDLIDNASLNVVNDSTGVIKNSVMVNVSTGSNLAVADNGEANIETGNTKSLVNLLNILNTNITGSNWLLGIINTFGNWKGNVAFGRPDLWLGASAVTSTFPGPAVPGGEITYTLSYINNGDADATGVTITDDFDERYVEVINNGGGVIIDNPGEIKWNIGNVPVGGTGSVSYSVAINSADEMPFGDTDITTFATIHSFEDDWNKKDNIETLSFSVYRRQPDSPAGASGEILTITKTNSAEKGAAFAGSDVDYQIVIHNDSQAQLYEVAVEDAIIHNETGEMFNNDSWFLGLVSPGEKIIIDYTVSFGSEVPAGLYKNTAKAEGQDTSGSPVWSDEAFSEITIKNSSAGGGVAEQQDGVNFKEIKSELDEIQRKIEVIKQQIKRMMPPPESSFKNGGDKLLKEASAPEALSQESDVVVEEKPATSEIEDNKEGLKRFLAALGVIPVDLRLILIILLIIALGLVALQFFSKKRG